MAEMKDKWRMTDEELAEVNGDKEACLAIIHAFDTCEGCSADCHKVALAAQKKLVEDIEKHISQLNQYWNSISRPGWLLSDDYWQQLKKELGID